MSEVRPLRVLCVDDDADARELLTVILELAGYEVVTAGTPEAGLRLARREVFSLIILDARFPGGTGVDLCREIREHDPHTPILFYSAAAEPAARQAAMQAGGQAYLVKPEGIYRLEEVVAQLTEASRRAE